MDPSVSIIVGNRNGAAFLKACLESLAGSGRPRSPHEIVVTDNASTDGSVALVRERFPSVRVLAHDRDLGLVASNNRAIAATTGRYVHLLNNDTIVLPGAIDRLVEFLDREPRAGAVGNHLIYPDGREQFSGRRFPSFANAIFGRRSVLSRWLPGNSWTQRYVLGDELDGRTPFEVDWVSAAGALYRRTALEATGPTPEDYLYWHEAGYFLAMKRLGWRVYLHPEAWIIHHEGMGSGERSPRVVAQHEFYFARGAQRFYCEFGELSRLDPRRWIAWLALYGRAAVLAAAGLLRLRGRLPNAGPALDRSVRAAYAQLVQMLMHDSDGPQLVMLTSVETGAGVTSTVAALGQELALRGNAETLLVDANPDEAKLHRVFWLATSAGLAEALADPALDVTELVQRVADRLALLPHGEAPYNLMSPGGRERLRTCMARLAQGRRFVLVDAPALDRRTDALSLASQVDAVILVVRAGTVEPRQIAEATARLRAAGGNVIGAIFNARPCHLPPAIDRRL